MTKERKYVSTILIMAWLAGTGSAAMASEGSVDIQKQIVEARKEYFSLYNTLNRNPQYEMVCRAVFEEWQCKPSYLVAARKRANDSCSRWTGISARDGTSTTVGFANWSPCDRNLDPEVTAQTEGFRKNVLELFQQSSELRALGLKLEELQERQR